jgi:fumarate hydratase subunit beta
VKVKHLLTPLTEADILALQAGQAVLISGIIYTARDAAHQKLAELQQSGQPLPFALHGQLLYYVGPSPARPGQVIGAAGPTTSSRMDRYTPALLAQGLKGCIGKGPRTQAVKDALVRYKAVYLAAVGGAGALLSRTVRQAEVVAYPELGPEAVYRLQVENFPAVVVNDAYGQDLYEQGQKQYRRQNNKPGKDDAHVPGR